MALLTEVAVTTEGTRCVLTKGTTSQPILLPFSTTRLRLTYVVHTPGKSAQQEDGHAPGPKFEVEIGNGGDDDTANDVEGSGGIKRRRISAPLFSGLTRQQSAVDSTPRSKKHCDPADYAALACVRMILLEDSQILESRPCLFPGSCHPHLDQIKRFFLLQKTPGDDTGKMSFAKLRTSVRHMQPRSCVPAISIEEWDAPRGLLELSFDSPYMAAVFIQRISNVTHTMVSEAIVRWWRQTKKWGVTFDEDRVYTMNYAEKLDLARTILHATRDESQFIYPRSPLRMTEDGAKWSLSIDETWLAQNPCWIMWIVRMAALNARDEHTRSWLLAYSTRDLARLIGLRIKAFSTALMRRPEPSIPGIPANRLVGTHTFRGFVPPQETAPPNQDTAPTSFSPRKSSYDVDRPALDNARREAAYALVYPALLLEAAGVRGLANAMSAYEPKDNTLTQIFDKSVLMGTRQQAAMDKLDMRSKRSSPVGPKKLPQNVNDYLHMSGSTQRKVDTYYKTGTSS